MPNDNLKILLAPFDVVPGDKAGNIRTVRNILDSISDDTDLIVLPELFSTGFSIKKSVLEALSESDDGETIAAIRNMAEKYDAAICGSYMSVREGKYYNRAFFIGPGRQENYYDKRHLFSLGKEDLAYSRGDRQAPTIGYRGWNIKMAICYDLRFPVWTRNVENDYDIMILPANWPVSRQYAWEHLLIARAIENQSYVAGCNRTGCLKDDDFGSNLSHIYDFNGKNIGERKPDGTITATLEKQKLIRARESFTPWRDSERFSIDFDY